MDYEAKFRKRDDAARVIQAAWRGHKQRRAFHRIQDAVRLIQGRIRTWNAKRKVDILRGKHAQDDRFELLMQRHRERMQVLEAEKRTIMRMPASDLDEWEQRRHRSATVVQAHWRGLQQRRRMAKSPRRQQREQAAMRIQSAFKQMMAARRPAGPSVSASLASLGGVRGSRSSPLRQSGASVLLGSPDVRGSAASLAGAAALAGNVRASAPRVMSSKRVHELETQVKGRVEAYKALAKGKGRGDPQQVADRLSSLLSAYNGSAQARLAAAHLRQRNLALMDTLCGQLDQVRPLAELGGDVQPQDFPRPPRGSERMERAAQAHALALAEAKVGGKWWVHLKGLNTQAVQSALLAEDEERWEALDGQWRRMWDQVAAEEAQRRDEVLEDRAARQHSAGRAAVAAAREAAAHDAQKAAYVARASAARSSVGTPPGARS